MAAGGGRVRFLQSCDPWEAAHAPVEDATPSHVLVALTVITEKIGRKEFAFSQFQARLLWVRHKSPRQALGSKPLGMPFLATLEKGALLL